MNSFNFARKYTEILKHFIYQIVGALLYANVFIALCAMAFTAEAYYLLNLQPVNNLLVIFNGISTFFIYQLIRVAAVKRIEKYEPDDRWKFFLKHIRLMRILTILSFIACVILFFFLGRKVQIALLVPGIVSVLYGISFQYAGKNFRLRDVGISKIFFISFVWAYIASMIPAVQAEQQIFTKQCVLLFLANFLFIFSITLPFDIKDMKIDSMNHVKTIPKILGTESTFTLAFLSLFLAGGIHLYAQNEITVTNHSVPLGVSMLITGLTIYLTRKRRGNFVYFGMLDGMMLLQFLLVRFYAFN